MLTLILHIEERKWRSLQSVFRCDCGVEITHIDSCVKFGKVTSCGCQIGRHERHGMARSPEYKNWDAMMQRCLNSKCKDYPQYGGRGIKIHEPWRDFVNFYRYMGNRPTKKHTLGRVDNDGNYEPGNVEWQTPAQQNVNTRGNHMLTYNGETLTISQWCEKTGIPQSALYQRIYYGWSVDKALTQPVRQKKKTNDNRKCKDSDIMG